MYISDSVYYTYISLFIHMYGYLTVAIFIVDWTVGAALVR